MVTNNYTRSQIHEDLVLRSGPSPLLHQTAMQFAEIASLLPNLLHSSYFYSYYDPLLIPGFCIDCVRANGIKCNTAVSQLDFKS